MKRRDIFSYLLLAIVAATILSIGWVSTKEIDNVNLYEEMLFFPHDQNGLNKLLTIDTKNESKHFLFDILALPIFTGGAMALVWLFFYLFADTKKRARKTLSTAPSSNDRNKIIINREHHLLPLSEKQLEDIDDIHDRAILLLSTDTEIGKNFLEKLPPKDQDKLLIHCLTCCDETTSFCKETYSKILKKWGLSTDIKIEAGNYHIVQLARLLNQLPLARAKNLLQLMQFINSSSLIHLKNEYFVELTLAKLCKKKLCYIAKYGGALDLSLAVYRSNIATKEKVLSVINPKRREKIAKELENCPLITAEKIQAAQIRISEMLVDFQRSQRQ